MIINLEDHRPKVKKKELVDELDVNGVLKDGDVYWTCACKHPLFFVTPDAIICQSCGQIQNWDSDKE